MTSPISSYSAGRGVPDTTGGASVAAQPPKAGGSAVGSAPADETGDEKVTLTPAAQTSTDLLEAARAASGVDDQTVQLLKSAIMSNVYQVPPDQLATSIVAALAEVRS